MSALRCPHTHPRKGQCRLTAGHMNAFHQYDNKQWWPLRRWVIARANGECQAKIPGACTDFATEAHHVIPRARGGPDELGNLIAICSDCHRWIHAHSNEASELGLLRSAPRQEAS